MQLKTRDRGNKRHTVESDSATDQGDQKSNVSRLHRSLLAVAVISIIVSLLLVLTGVSPGLPAAYQQFLGETNPATPAQ